MTEKVRNENAQTVICKVGMLKLIGKTTNPGLSLGFLQTQRQGMKGWWCERRRPLARVV